MREVENGAGDADFWQKLAPKKPFIIEVADLDAALAWAARCPAVDHGVVEVRPLANLSA